MISHLIKLVEKMPIETSHLRSSLIGRVFMFYTKCERVNGEIKKKCEMLVRRWMRPILGKSADHRHRKTRDRAIVKIDRARKPIDKYYSGF